MKRSVEFYQELGLTLAYGGPTAGFSSLHAGDGFINLAQSSDYTPAGWGRIIFRVEDVNAVYTILIDAGLDPDMTPQDAPWGERYFHIRDPDGHELSFAELLKPRS